MKRLSIFLLLLLAFGTTSQKALALSPRYLLILDHIPQLTTLVRPEQLLYTEEGVSIVRLDVAEVEAWSLQVHRRLGACGGFADVTSSVSRGMDPKTIVWRELMRRKQRPPVYGFRLRPRSSIITLVNGGNSARFWEFLTKLSSFNDRSATTPSGVKAAQYVQQYAQQLGGRIPGFRTALIETDRNYPQPSVMAVIPGSDPTLGGVVIGGHLDTYSTDKPGADDDGSGSAVVMEALTAVAQTGARFKRTLYFLWYAAEERGLVGSNRVVQYFGQNKFPVRAAMQMDMVGYNSTSDNEDIYLITDYTNDELNRVTQQLILQYVGGKVGHTKCGYACSDHVSWHRAGIPVVFPFESTSGNMNRRLHTKNDTMGFLDQIHGFRFVKTALAFAGEMAELTGFQK
jgi:bacterial leucyl aminopeptidase